jgi:hypothetical protein
MGDSESGNVEMSQENNNIQVGEYHGEEKVLNR